MQIRLTSKLAWSLAVAAIGCGVQASDSVSQVSTEHLSQALTVQDCADDFNECLSRDLFLGALTCPTAYAQCTEAVAAGVPAQVASAARDAAVCAREAAGCRVDSGGLSDVSRCTETEAECVAAIVDVQLPSIVTGTANCVIDAESCIEGSKSAAELTACGSQLNRCAVDQAASTLPPEVSDAIAKVNQCRESLQTCVSSAEDPRSIPLCTEANVRCVADTLNVVLPQIPARELAECADTAASCTVRANSVDSVADCAAGLRTCIRGVASGPGEPDSDADAGVGEP